MVEALELEALLVHRAVAIGRERKAGAEDPGCRNGAVAAAGQFSGGLGQIQTQINHFLVVPIIM